MTDKGALITDAPSAASAPDIEAGARKLIAAMAADGWGRTSASIYETGRLVSLAPWLPAHAARIDHLLREQRTDGGWGPPEGYALIPTLSATEALLATYRRVSGGGTADGSGSGPSSSATGPTLPASATGPTLPTSATGPRLAAAVGRAIRTLDGWLRPGGRLRLADTPAADLIVPALVARINEHLGSLADASPQRSWPWPQAWRVDLPADISAARLVATRRAIATGAAIPEKLLHALEVVGELARRAPGVRPVPPGTVGASPAATAAWLGGPDEGYADPEATAARRFLAQVIRQGGGPVPCATPITVFERSWVLSGLIRVGMVPAVPGTLLQDLAAAVGPAGAAAGPGLPADADTTSMVLYTLAGLGAPMTTESLWRYDTGAHFCTWLGEDGCSVSTNAHLLEALGHAGTAGTAAGSHRLTVTRRLSDWLCERQLPGGEWHDRWHASPYYATACTALALGRYGHGRAASRAVSRAIDWVRDTQRPDGSWGRWTGTVEESAYAMQVLLVAGRPDRNRIGVAVARGYAYLVDAAGQEEDPPLWHDKDLYAPYSIVRSATLAALKGVQSRPDLMTTANLSMR